MARVGASFCSPECKKKQGRELYRRPSRKRRPQQTEADKYREKMSEVRL
jgi:hypothetical protein